VGKACDFYWEKRSACRVLEGKPEVNRDLEDLVYDQRIVLKWQRIVLKWMHKYVGWEDINWISVAQGGEMWWTVVNVIWTFIFHRMQGIS